ncbi:hypothetical protein SOV_41850 [Sporomusa ovata DSM 2662]|uniref:Accessory protein YqeC in selenium-dependent molybdenum hydroxylase maturation n=1 Tax=Sporomusa ovata TaxID=2378 RepID=A0A0U1KTB7_9FIRM|nr:selenium cofactor biosynthesis protein YqeC [Sporomusa ovata]EQB26573.1 selenium-dependent hydroxylase accessory protein YqeC [Sporomusa ovata DSM 2662]CQR70662.1 Accessory protein YqeC in selenium-dependent molybdenum hydroxylase maturation [Sporomusa ovata]
MLIDAIGLKQPGVVACVGAGGKTSLIQSLVAAGLRWPIVLTTTTKMFYRQITSYPLVVTDNYGTGAAKVMQALAKQQQVAWFSRQKGEKVIGIPFDWVDKLAAALPDACILVEADGARHCLIKAPSAQEPVIPVSTMRTIGVINISALEQPLSSDNTHRLELVTQIINKQPGEPITWQDIARLAVHQQGIFQYARGSKVLLLSGSDGQADRQAAKQIAGYVKVADVGIDRVVVTLGYGVAMQPSEVYML